MVKSEILLADPLNDIARKTRRSLIAFCCISLIATHMGLVPSKIENLGIIFTNENKEAFFILTMVAMVYLTISFIIYSLNDFLNWYLINKKPQYRSVLEKEKGLVRMAIETNRIKQDRKVEEMHEKLDKEILQEVDSKINKILWWSMPLVYSRLLIDILFPILLSCYSVYHLIRHFSRL